MHFNWHSVRQREGIYPKLGYGKPASLGSVCLLVSEMDLLDSTSRYSGASDSWSEFGGKGSAQICRNMPNWEGSYPIQINAAREGKETIPPYLHNLRSILRFPNHISGFGYPTLVQGISTI